MKRLEESKMKGLYLIGEPKNCSSKEDFLQKLDQILEQGISISSSESKIGMK